ncbi:hypothetical protein KL953_00035 [Mycolicibacterium goodii]|uniref:hypothetical protein n=1 Tax=Mycolicibacterium goodii TaxID=134601 RepID=UPI001BDC5C20|nr:hypothetical protein [Mycolicibacterium goodii]MBU8807280.1 hypothetical protein [Mycolicibacterium goodii]
MRDTWLERDLPVLRAAIAVFERDGDPMDIDDIAAEAGFDTDTTQRALRALSTEPFFSDGRETGNGDILWVGKPTGAALRVAGQWPTAENLLERLVTALEAAGEDGTRTPEERGKLRQIALGLRTAAAQIAISALGSAGGNLLSG